MKFETHLEEITRHNVSYELFNNNDVQHGDLQ